MAGKMVEFPTNGHMTQGYLATPAAGKGPGVLVIQEWWGLVPHIEDVCERFAAEGFLALAPDLYHGESSSEPDEAGKLMMGLNIQQAAKDMSGAVDLLQQRSGKAEGRDREHLAFNRADFRGHHFQSLKHEHEVPLGPDSGRSRRKRVGFHAKLPGEERGESCENAQSREPSDQIAQQEVRKEFHRPHWKLDARRDAHAMPLNDQ